MNATDHQIGPNRWFILTVLFLARTAMGLQFQSVGSVGPILVDGLGIDYAGVGLLIGLYLFPGVFIALPGGMLGERFGAKSVACVGLVLMIAGGLVMGLSAWFPALVLGRLVSGVGAVLMNVMLTKMVVDWFAGREMATAMAVLVTSWPLGIALGLLGFVPVAAAFGWPAVMTLSALVCAASLIAIAVFYREPTTHVTKHAASLSLSLSKREWVLVSIAGLVWGTYNVGYILLVSFLPGHLADGGYVLARANALVSWLGWGLIVMVPIGGLIADRLRWPDAVMATGFIVAGVATVILAADLALLLPAFALVAFTIGLPAGPVMTLPAAAVAPQNRATGMGIYFTWYYALMAGVPTLAGFARDVTHNGAVPVLFAAGMLAAALGVQALFLVVSRRWAAASLAR
ncbi:MFS transporter [Microbacteriaceae bacterium K1510]|nr:MFS transporter [Microbacteriaceae bacterium K1510]